MYGPGSVTFNGRDVRVRAYPVFGYDTEPVGCRDRLDDLEPMLLVVAAGPQPTVGGQRADAGQMPVELGGEEAGPTHLAVAHDVDAGRLLVLDREVDCVVQHLG